MTNGSSGKGEKGVEKRGNQPPLKPSGAPSSKIGARLDVLKRTVGKTVDIRQQREELKEGIDKDAYKYEQYYELGSAKAEEVEHEKEIEKIVLSGSVDSTRFLQRWYKPDWYLPYIDAAVMVSNCYRLLDESTKKWFDDLNPAIEIFKKLGTYNKSKFQREYKNEIWKLVEGHGKDIVYGPKGALNFLLAFRRITNIYPDLKKVKDEKFDIDELKIDVIKMSVGAGKGKKGGKKDRYSRIVAKKIVKAPIPKEPVQPAGVGQEAKPEPPKAGEPEKIVQPAEIPKFGTEEFYKYYEIPDSAAFYETLKPLEPWLGKEKSDFLKDKKFWENIAKKPTEGDAEYTTRISKLFGRADGEISKLSIDLEQFRFTYIKFFEDSNNPESVKYQELYFWATKRLIEYSDKFVPDAGQRNLAFLQYHEAMLEGATNLRLVKEYEKPVLEQLTASAQYMADNDPDEANKTKWKRLLEQYKGELEKLTK